MTIPGKLANQASGEVDPADPAWDALLCDGFSRYRKALHQLSQELRRQQLPFKLPTPHHLAFDTMAGAWGETAETHWWRLTNEVNDLGYCLDRLSAWQKSLDGSSSSDERLALLAEFVMPLAHHALNLPMALKSRFAFAAWRTSHEMNALLFPPGTATASEQSDHDKAPLNFNNLWHAAKRWSGTKQLIEAVEAIYPRKRDKDAVFSYRDRFMHRIPPYIEHGVSGQAKLVRSGGCWTVHMHEELPLPLSEILKTLVPSHTAAVRAREALGNLLNEQWTEVVSVYPSVGGV